MTLDIQHTFDEQTYRHFLNGFNFVLHCHHYMTLTTKLAQDFDGIGGTRILCETAEDTIRPVLDDYIRKHGISAPAERLSVGAAFYSLMGMGTMEATGSAEGGTATLPRSHVDQGWLKKWGPHTSAVNHFSRGYIAAVFGAAFDKPPRSYQVTETASIVAGAPVGEFRVGKA